MPQDVGDRRDQVDARSLSALFDRTVESTPDAVCLVDGAHELTYRDARAAVAALAGRLVAAGVGPGDRIGLLLGRTHRTVVAVLAVLRCGGVYVPLDPDYPDERLRFVTADADLRFVVRDDRDDRTDAGRLGRPDLTVIDVRETGSPAAAVDAGPADGAYVIYTSGSTGRPKGCLVTHGNVLALLGAALPVVDARPADRWSLFHSASFDFSVWEMWGPLATGARIVVVPGDVARRPDEFLRFLGAHRITVLNQVPSVFRALVTAYRERPASGAVPRCLVFGGESIDLDVVRAFVDAAPRPPMVVNMYGITETTVHATSKVLSRAELAHATGSPIGVALPHLRIDLRDADGRLVADGEIGEMWVAGDGVAVGYLGQPELTAQRFVTVDGVRRYRSGDLARRRPDGELEYVGRGDDQVKVRGFRIELGEIEVTLRGHRDVRDVAVTVVENGVGARFLVACVVRAPGVEDVRTPLREHARAALPPHMVPDRFVVLDALPLTASGKLDRAALPSLARGGRAAVAR